MSQMGKAYSSGPLCATRTLSERGKKTGAKGEHRASGLSERR